MSIQSKSFGDALRAARRKAFLTQHDLAELIGAPHVNSISRWERNAVVPSLFYRLSRNKGAEAERMRGGSAENDSLPRLHRGYWHLLFSAQTGEN